MCIMYQYFPPNKVVIYRQLGICGNKLVPIGELVRDGNSYLWKLSSTDTINLAEIINICGLFILLENPSG